MFNRHYHPTSEARTNPISLHNVKRDDVNSRIMDAMLRHRTMLVLAENGVVHDIIKILNPIIISTIKMIVDPKSPLVIEAVNIAHVEILKTPSRRTWTTEATPVPPQVAFSVADSLTDMIQARLKKSEAQVAAIIKDALFEVARTEFDVMKELVNKGIPKKVRDELALQSVRVPEAVTKVLRGGIAGELDQVAIDKIVNNPLGGGYAPRLKQRYGTSLKKLKKIIAAGMIDGQDIPTIGRQIKGVLDFELRGGAARLARTEIHRVAAEAQDEMYQQNKDIIKRQTWTTALDANVCLRCGQMDGQAFDVGKGPKIPLHPNCRCFYTPVTKSWSELGIGGGKLSFLEKQAMNGKIPGRTNFLQFFNGQNAAFQKQVLGPTRFDLWSKGAIKFDQLATAQRIKPVTELLKIAKKPVKKAAKKIVKKAVKKRVKKRVSVKRVTVKRIRKAPQAGPVQPPTVAPPTPTAPTPGVRQATVPGAEHPSFSIPKSTPQQVDAAFSDVMTERAHELTRGKIVNSATLSTDLGGANAHAFTQTKEQIEGFYKGWGWNTKFAKGPPGAARWDNTIVMHERITEGLGRLWNEKLLKPWMKRRAPSRIPGFTGLPPGSSVRTMRAWYLRDPEKATMFKNLVHENVHIIGRASRVSGAGPFSPDAKVYAQKAFRALEEATTETLARQEYKGVARKLFGFSEAETAAIADAPGTTYSGWESLLDDLDIHMPKATQGKQWVSRIKYSTKLEDGFDEMAGLMSRGMVEQGFASLDATARKNLAKELHDIFEQADSFKGLINQKQRIADAASHAIGKIVPVPVPQPLPFAPPPITVPVQPPVVPQITGLRARVTTRVRDALDEEIKRSGANYATMSPSVIADSTHVTIDNTMKALNPSMSFNAQNRLKSRFVNSAWKESSFNPSSLGLRQAASDTFGGRVYKGRELMNASTVSKEIHAVWDVSVSPSEVDEIIKGFKDWVQIRYELTQRILDNQRLGSKLLHRGVRVGETSLGKIPVGEKVVLKRSTGSVSSFTTRKSTSQNFGDVSFGTRVKQENILGNLSTGMGHSGEAEWVVLGDETDFVVKVTKNNLFRGGFSPPGPTPLQKAKKKVKRVAKKKARLKKLKLKRQKLKAKRAKAKVDRELKRKRLKLKRAKAKVAAKQRKDKLIAKRAKVKAAAKLKKEKLIAKRAKIKAVAKQRRDKLIARRAKEKQRKEELRLKLRVKRQPTGAPLAALRVDNNISAIGRRTFRGSKVTEFDVNQVARDLSATAKNTDVKDFGTLVYGKIRGQWQENSDLLWSLNVRASASRSWGGQVFKGKRVIDSGKQFASTARFVREEFGLKMSPKEVSQAMSDWVQTRYVATQNVLAKEKFKDVVLYRGLRLKTGKLANAVPGTELNLNVGSISSFTTDPDIAARFGGTIIKTTVPKKFVLSNHKLGMGVNSEKEWLVLGDRQNFKSVILASKKTIKVGDNIEKFARLAPRKMLSISEKGLEAVSNKIADPLSQFSSKTLAVAKQKVDASIGLAERLLGEKDFVTNKLRKVQQTISKEISDNLKLFSDVKLPGGGKISVDAFKGLSSTKSKRLIKIIRRHEKDMEILSAVGEKRSVDAAAKVLARLKAAIGLK